MQYFISKFLFLILGFSFLSPIPCVHAEGLINVDFEDDPLFDIENIYPGKSFTKDVTVKNEDAVERDLYVTMDGMDNDDFADQINFYVIKKIAVLIWTICIDHHCIVLSSTIYGKRSIAVITADVRIGNTFFQNICWKQYFVIHNRETYRLIY